MSRMITESEVRNAATKGISQIVVEPGTVVTPSARDLARTLGICLECGMKKAASVSADTGACSTAAMVKVLDNYLQEIWTEEPDDLKKLRNFKLPPMGNMPCVLYASFNLFWLGESMQVWRLTAKKKALPVQSISYVVSQDMTRHMGRLAKWDMKETVNVIKAMESYFANQGPKSYEEIETVLTHALVTLDRVQNWIDGAIPWSKMDGALKLNRLSQVDAGRNGGCTAKDLNEEDIQKIIDSVLKQVLKSI